MRYFYWALLALNIFLLISSIVRGSSLWPVNLIGIAAMLVALYSEASTRRHKKRLAELRAENNRLFNERFKDFR